MPQLSRDIALQLAGNVNPDWPHWRRGRLSSELNHTLAQQSCHKGRTLPGQQPLLPKTLNRVLTPHEEDFIYDFGSHVSVFVCRVLIFICLSLRCGSGRAGPRLHIHRAFTGNEFGG